MKIPASPPLPKSFDLGVKDARSMTDEQYEEIWRPKILGINQARVSFGADDGFITLLVESKVDDRRFGFSMACRDVEAFVYELANVTSMALFVAHVKEQEQ